MQNAMALTAGLRLERYEIVSPLGVNVTAPRVVFDWLGELSAHVSPE